MVPSCADRAGPPSPLKPKAPVPANVVMIPSGPTLRTLSWPDATWLMYRLLSGPTASAKGLTSWAWVAGPPSPQAPLEQGLPLPATVVMIPSGDTFRTRWLPLSAMNRLPSGPSAIPIVVPSAGSVCATPPTGWPLARGSWLSSGTAA